MWNTIHHKIRQIIGIPDHNCRKQDQYQTAPANYFFLLFLHIFLLQPDPLQTVHCLDSVLVTSESRQAEVMFTAWSESGSGGTYHVDIL